ncbi:MAG TPA: FAD-dependent oxidoreductase [Rhodospirillaceae bacterium]|nr:FAD-dependent oxidoreductase [Rhodospirillaceae bacterium]
MPPINLTVPVRFTDPLPTEVDVAVIGGGVAGTATAYFLAERGERVLLCEKGRIAGEQSSRNWGWIRQQGRDYAELPIMMESNRIWQGLAERTGERDLTFTQQGCLYLAENEADMAKYESWYDLAKQHQLDTELLTTADLEKRFPGIAGQYVGAMVTPSDGRGEPFVAIPALARAAQRAGVVVIEECAVRTLDVTDGKLTGIFTEKGRVACSRAILAAGAWSTHFAHNAGIDLPQLAVRCTVGRTEVAPELFSEGAPVPNIKSPGLSVRRRADGGYSLATGSYAEHYLSPKSFKYFTKFLNIMKITKTHIRLRLGAPNGYPGAWGTPRRWGPDEESPFERMRVLHPEPNPSEVTKLEERVRTRFPALADTRLEEAWAGMIDVTPDVVPTLGETPEIAGLHICTGLSGHGFGIGPGIGRVMADLVTGSDPGHDLTRFRPERFFDGSPIVPGPY